MITEYSVCDVRGTVVAIHCREDTAEGKRISWRMPDGTLGLNGMRLAALPFYGTERLKRWSLDATLVICEGEKATEALWQHDCPALGTVTGASSCPGARALSVVRDRAVVLWPDHDTAGYRHMTAVGRGVFPYARSVRWLAWDDVEHGDAADYFAMMPATCFRKYLLPTASAWIPPPCPPRIRRVPDPRDFPNGTLLQLVAAAGVEMRQVGKHYQGWCPFHPDWATKSFAVWPDENRWWCFGACGSGGGVLDFVQQWQRCSRMDARRWLREYH